MSETLIYSKQLKSDFNHKPLTVFLSGCFVLGIILSAKYNTFIEAIGVGVLLIGLYGVSFAFKKKLYPYVASTAIAGFTALFVYQTHGMIEMNFVSFFGTILLLYYRDWKFQLPLFLVIIVHHVILAWLQLSGVKDAYFTNQQTLPLDQLTYNLLFTAGIFILTMVSGYLIGKNFDQIHSIEKEMETQIALTEKGIQFADLMSKGELESTLVVDDHDQLGHALLTMQKNLLEAKRKEDSDRYLNVGLAQTSDLLRHQYESIEQMADAVILKVIKYVGASQGAIYIAETDYENTTTLVLKGCYAYNRKKFLNQKIAIGEGLVGQAAIEKEPVYLTEVPEDYINITSGLGEALPRCVLIQPLMVNETIFGVIELASFEVMPDYKMNYISKVSESIASTISSVMINSKTAILLEQSQQQSEEMRAQEEEMRQNMEELSATQEEMMRKDKELTKVLEDALNNERLLKIKIEEINSLEEADKKKTEQMMAEVESNRLLMRQIINQLPEKIFVKDENKRLVVLNQATADVYDNKTVDDLIGTSDFDIFPHDVAQKYSEVEDQVIKEGKTLHFNEEFPMANGDIKYFYTIKMPFKFPNHKIGLLGYQMDMTELKQMEQKVKSSEIDMIAKEKALQDEIKKQHELIEKLTQENNTLKTKQGLK